MNSLGRGVDPQTFLDADFTLGDQKDSLGIAGWWDSYMDELMGSAAILPDPQGPNFAPARPAPEGEIRFGVEAVRPDIVTGNPNTIFTDNVVPEIALDYADRSGSSNSGDSRPDGVQQHNGSLSKAAARALAVAEKNRKVVKPSQGVLHFFVKACWLRDFELS
jgi:hypothetical protein